MAFDEYLGARRQRGYDVPVQVDTPTESDTSVRRQVDMSWWKQPDFVAAEKALQAQGRQQMATQERQARRELNATLLSDIARMGGQIWANKGGAWKIDRTEPASAAANTRLRELRNRNAAMMMQYAERMQEAKRRDAADAANKERTRITLQQQADKAAADEAYRKQQLAQKQAELAAQQRQKQAELDATQAYRMQQLAETQRHNKAQEAHSNAGRVPKTITVGGRTFTDATDKNYAYHALEYLMELDPTVREKYKKKIGGGSAYDDSEGERLYNLDENDILNEIAEYNARQTRAKHYKDDPMLQRIEWRPEVMGKIQEEKGKAYGELTRERGY